MAHVLYISIVGCLIYLLIYISQIVSVINKYMKNSYIEHWNVVKWIFRYLSCICDCGIMFDKNGASNVAIGYVDSNHSGNLDNRRSMISYVFTFDNSCINWKINLKDTIVRFTIKVEYMVMIKVEK